MNRKTLSIALMALLLPILVRAVWFYPWFPAPRGEVPTPDYESLTIPQPPLETPDANEKISRKSGVALIDLAHNNQFQLSEIQAFQKAIEQRGGNMETATDAITLEGRLKYASSYVIISPSVPLTMEETRLVRAFVERGGRLAVFTDATRGVMSYDFFSGAQKVTPDVNVVNPLLAYFGISVNNDYLYNLDKNEGNFRNVFFDKFGKNELTFGLKQVIFYGTHSVQTDSGLILLRGADQTLSSITDAHDPAEGAAAISEDGNVVTFGDFSFLTSPYSGVADNATLIGSLADFLLSGKRSPSLATFPYVFRQPVVRVYPTSDVQMTSELVAALGKLQATLQAANIDIQIATEEPDEGDVMVLGSFAPAEDLLPFVEAFDLSLDGFTEFVSVPGFGNVGRHGNGILLLKTGSRGNTLVLLADTVDDLTALLDTLSGGSLTSCILQKDVGVCSVGFGGGFSEEPTIEMFPSEGMPTEVPALELQPTPTPVG